MIALGLAFTASIGWGASDFIAGLVSRRLSVLVVLLGAQVTGLVLATIAWRLSGAPLPSAGAAAVAAGGGLAELVGLGCLYRGLACGDMCVVAPLSALAGVVPVLVTTIHGDPLTLPVAGGAALAMLGSTLCAIDSEAEHPRLARGAALGIAAALCFGVFFVGLGGAAHSGGIGVVPCARLTSLIALAALCATRRTPIAPCPADVGLIAALGALDMVANLTYALASAPGLRAAVAVLGSLCPLTTVLLARLVLKERVGPLRNVGVAGVICGVALISLP
jgi:drug/metabolite transporter (DMT)-like permease